MGTSQSSRDGLGPLSLYLQEIGVLQEQSLSRLEMKEMPEDIIFGTVDSVVGYDMVELNVEKVKKDFQ